MEQKQAFSIIKPRSKPVAVFCLACRVFKYWEISHKNTDFRLLWKMGRDDNSGATEKQLSPSEGDALSFLNMTWSLHLGLPQARMPLAWPLQEPCSKAIWVPFKCRMALQCAWHTNTEPGENVLRGQALCLFNPVPRPGTVSAWYIIYHLSLASRMDRWMNEWLSGKKWIWVTRNLFNSWQKSRLINTSAAFWVTCTAPYTFPWVVGL